MHVIIQLFVLSASLMLSSHAMTAAWAAYKAHSWTLKETNERADNDGWSKRIKIAKYYQPTKY